MTNRPTKPSDLNARGTRNDGTKYWLHHTYYFAYNDPNSTEYPIVVFLCDSWNADPESEESGILVMSFKSQEGYNMWVEEAGLNPDNAEPIDPEDADELAGSGITLITINNHD